MPGQNNTGSIMIRSKQPMPFDAMGALKAMVQGQRAARPQVPDPLEALAPVDHELQDMQQGDIDEGRKRGGPFVVRSRDSFKDAAMAGLKRKLGLDAIKHGQEMEKTTAPHMIRGEYDLKQEGIRGEYGLKETDLRGRYDVQTEGIRGRAHTDAARIGSDAAIARLQAQIDARQALQDDRQAWDEAHPKVGRNPDIPASMYDAVTKAEAAIPGNPLTRMINGKSANATLQAALTAFLDRKGTRQDIDALAQAIAAQPGGMDEATAGLVQQLDTYEQRYLQLKLGQ